MCGIAGVLDLKASTTGDELAADASAMARTLAYRGPDGEATWVDEAAGVALGHRRLAVVDLSDAAAQPMTSACGRYVISFNGEIYNFGPLRQELAAAGHRFRGTGDTETLLTAISAWSYPVALERAEGMFAFALWDREERVLHLARDRMGEKPLYYGRFGPTVLFGSELKALRAHRAFRADIDRDAVADLLALKYVPAPRSIFENVKKLPPATTLAIPAGSTGDLPDPVSYWSLPEQTAKSELASGELVDQVESLLATSIQARMIADVPVGAFLSGGIDSSTVVALMQRVGAPVRTFTVGFADSGFDEAHHAQAVAAHLGTDHTRVDLGADEAQAVIPDLATIYDEPFADSSQIATVLISRVARQDVTVCLSGDGGDELFGGYNRHRAVPRMYHRFGRLPRPMRRGAGRLAGAVPAATWDRAAELVPARRRPRLAGNKMTKVAGALTTDGPLAMYKQVVSHWHDPLAVVVGARPHDPLGGLSLDADGDLTAQLMRLDAATYLPGDILTKVDRASMSASLEVRVPLLDRALVEFALSLPSSAHVGNHASKHLVREVLARHVPPALTARPKMGFGVPVGEWIRGPLRGWAEDLLDPNRLKREGYLVGGPITEKWRQHQSGRTDWTYDLWDVLMFQSWLETQG